jgi:isopenicillin N synthase-like dioxygenase
MPDLRKILIEYFEECAVLSDRIARLMAQGLGMPVECYQDFLRELKDSHSSYLRLNYYPTCSDEEKKEEGTLGISPHRDAGFLTVLYQDYDCHSLQMWHKNEWITIHPLPNSLTINTGDMAMLFSNGRYHAPLHRVLTNDSQKRYSAPFFYNPGYHQWINSGFGDTEPRKYHPCLFGYFRAVRFAGDLTDLGVEIQTSDYEIDEETGEESHHLAKQKVFAKTEGIFSQAFSVESYRPLLVGE